MLTEELAERCICDVELNLKLWRRLQPKADSIPCAVDLEMRFAQLIALQERSGFGFNVQGALELEAEINQQLNTLSERLRQRFPFVDGGLFTPKRDNAPRGYVAGAAMCRLTDLNPNSREHIAWVLQNSLSGSQMNSPTQENRRSMKPFCRRFLELRILFHTSHSKSDWVNSARATMLG